MERRLCTYCRQSPIVGRNWKYCPDHARQASAIWKREHRRTWKAAGDKYWLSDWKTPEERRAYFPAYMREWRQRRRERRTA